MMTECTHAYTIPKGEVLFCLLCRKFVPKPQEQEEKALVMPPRVFKITEDLWNRVKPWQYIPFHLTQKYGWYISLINCQEYLIMPILRCGNPVYYSARKISKGEGSKYLYPVGVKKSYWTSSDNLEGDIVIICEGVADAAYCSMVAPSIALLGSHYNGCFDKLLANRHIALCMDSDAMGIYAAFMLQTKLSQQAKSTKIVLFPNKFDPTDVPIVELARRISQ